MIELNLTDLLDKKVLTVEASRLEERIAYYNKCKESKEAISIKFSGIVDNCMFIEDNGLRVMLPKEELSKIFVDFKPSLRISFNVIVKEVNENTRTVIVSVVDLKQSVRDKYIPTIEHHLSNGDSVCVRAKVVYIDKSKKRALIDIAGAGIKGYIPVEEWRDAYTYSLMNVTKVGDIVKVVIMGKSKNTNLGYKCSRRLALDEDVWKNIEQRFPLKSLVKVKCLYLTKKEWFGSIEGLHEIEAYCPYPDDIRQTPIIIGQEYMCYVYMVNEKTRQLRCRVIRKIEEN